MCDILTLMAACWDTIRELGGRDHNEHLASARAEGKRVVGYFCSYVPEELIHAAGMVPYRMRAVGSVGTHRGDEYFSGLNCSFVRHCFDKALCGDFEFLDGVVFSNGCDHTRRTYDNWRHAELPPDFLHMFVIPHVLGETAVARLAVHMERLKSAIEEHFSCRITAEDLGASIRLYNRKRELLQEISDSRLSKEVPIKGSEMLSLVLAVTALPVERAIEFLEEVKEAIRGRSTANEGDCRIFMLSGALEEREHLELIEDCGAAIVGDSFCFGTRHYDGLVDESGECIPALAKRYLEHLSCPRMMNDFRRRLSYARAAIERLSVDASIIEKLKFCDLWGGEAFIFKREFKKHGLLLLALERELYGGGQGQIRTRVQALLEQVRARREDPPEGTS